MQQLTPIAERRQVDIELTPLFEGVESFMEKADAPLIQLCESLTGRSAGSVAFATEAPFFQMLGAQTVVLGPGDIEQAHQPDEYLELSRVEPMLEILGRAITELCCRANPS